MKLVKGLLALCLLAGCGKETTIIRETPPSSPKPTPGGPDDPGVPPELPEGKNIMDFLDSHPQQGVIYRQCQESHKKGLIVEGFTASEMPFRNGTVEIAKDESMKLTWKEAKKGQNCYLYVNTDSNCVFKGSSSLCEVL